MRHHLTLRFAALAGGIFGAASAYAQSSVTLYGSVDGGLAYIHNIASANGANESSEYRFASGTLHGNRWGLRGTEDLGGGAAAVFVLENGFDRGTGVYNQGAGNLAGRQRLVLRTRRLARSG
jgi:predicted porin